MPDILSQGARIDADEANPDHVAKTLATSLGALESAAERSGLALDWSQIKIVVGPDATWPNGLKVNVAAPVL